MNTSSKRDRDTPRTASSHPSLGVTPRLPVSVMIPVKNEEANIAACLRSVSWADECVVVDSGSHDRTREIASELGAVVVDFSWQPGSPKKKNWTLANHAFRNVWILILDADERIPPDLAAEIATKILDDSVDGYYLNRRFYFLGRWIRHAGYFPSWNLRLFRLGKAKYEFVPDFSLDTGDNEVHEHVILDGKASKIDPPMDHYAFPDIYTFVEKHNRYSSWEAKCYCAAELLASTTGPDRLRSAINFKRRLRRIARQGPCPHWWRFLYHYVLRRGFLDGRPGYYLSHLLAEYEFQIRIKHYESLVAGPASVLTPGCPS